MFGTIPGKHYERTFAIVFFTVKAILPQLCDYHVDQVEVAPFVCVGLVEVAERHRRRRKTDSLWRRELKVCDMMWSPAPGMRGSHPTVASMGTRRMSPNEALWRFTIRDGRQVHI